MSPPREPDSAPPPEPSGERARSGQAEATPSRRRWPWIAGGIALALLLAFALFDWNWLRGPAERYASRSIGRPVTIGHLDVRLFRLTPAVVLSDVTLGNAQWAGSEPMGRARELTFDVRLLSLLTDEIVLPHMKLVGGEVGFVRDAQGRANWRFREREERGRRNVRVLTLGIDDTHVTLRDALIDLQADFRGMTRKEGRYETRIEFNGRWRGGAFDGVADTGSALSLRGSTEPFPMRIVGRAGATRLRAEGEVADITRFRHVDAELAISGPSLASLYDVLKVALPDTPPYEAVGHFRRDGDTYSYGNFKGTIGSSDVAGDAEYALREPRPLLTAHLQSGTLDLADLGPLVGARPGAARTQGSDRRAEAGNAKAAPRADAADRGAADGRVLPDTPFNLEKLNSMDADVRLTAERLRFPGQVPLRDFAARARLDNGVLTLEPLNFAFAGGDVVARVVLDAGSKPIAGNLSADFKRVQLKQLFPTLEQFQQSSGRLGAQVRLKGSGNSVAALLASANGSVAAGMAGGRVSEIAVWLVNLNGGELIPLLFGGDRPTPIRCAAAAMDVRNGIGEISTFVFDTEESRMIATGGVDFRNERIDVTLRPEAKKPGLLSIRGPIHIRGTFRDPHFAVAPQSVARGLGAIALGVINPILALLPLVETGPGEDTNCRALLEPVKGALRQSGKSVEDAPAKDAPAKGAPAKDETVGRESPAPIVEVPAGKARRQPPAPVVEVPPKK